MNPPRIEHWLLNVQIANKTYFEKTKNAVGQKLLYKKQICFRNAKCAKIASGTIN